MRTTIRVKLDPGAVMPKRAHEADAGYDIYSRDAATIKPGDSATFDTGVHVEIPAGYAGFLKSKSGLNVLHGLTGEGVIDSGYTGSICVKLYNHGTDVYQVREGDKISQLVLLEVFTPELEQADSLGETERGAGGFGSTGR